MAAKRIWMARDCGYTSDPKTQALGDEFGAEGPLVVEEVFALAKLAQEPDRLVIHYGVLARRAFTTAARTRKILDAAFELGMLDLVERAGPRGVVVTLPRYARWQVKDPSNAQRQARHRDKDRATPSPPAPQDHPALHPAFADVMAIAQQTASKDQTIQPPQDFAIERTLRAYPHANHVEAANLAASDLASGRRTTRHFHVVLADRCADQAPKHPPRPHTEDYYASDPTGLFERTRRQSTQTQEATA